MHYKKKKKNTQGTIVEGFIIPSLFYVTFRRIFFFFKDSLVQQQFCQLHVIRTGDRSESVLFPLKFSHLLQLLCILHFKIYLIMIL